MISIVLSIILGVVAFYFSKTIRKRFNILLGLAVVLSVIALFGDNEAFSLIIDGFVGLAFFIIVMIAGGFKRTSNISKRFRSVRKEYSILGFVFLLPHFITYTLRFLNGEYPWEWFGIVAMLVMIPLFVTSFKVIKSKMSIKKWKNMQRWAYLAYLLIFIHLILIGQEEHIIAYIVVFSLYSLLKLKNFVLSSDKQTQYIANVAYVVFLAGYLLISNDVIDVEASFTSGNTDYTKTVLEDGIFSGSASGFKSYNVDVDVTVVDGEITDIDINSYGATSSHGGVNFKEAVEEIALEVIDTQSTDIDAISGATKSTQGLLDAVDDALN